jgi:hypothetical protein
MSADGSKSLSVSEKKKKNQNKYMQHGYAMCSSVELISKLNNWPEKVTALNQ